MLKAIKGRNNGKSRKEKKIGHKESSQEGYKESKLFKMRSESRQAGKEEEQHPSTEKETGGA